MDKNVKTMPACNPGDIATLNAIIDNNGLKSEKAPEIMGNKNEISKRRNDIEDFHQKVYGNPLISDKDFNIIMGNSIKEYNVLYEDTFYRKIYKIDEVYPYLPEGIDIEIIDNDKYISYNPKHENYVSTSIHNKPTKNKKLGNNIKMWSIFKRNHLIKHDFDGNPLLYALKNENGWKFKTEEDKTKILNQIYLIVNKLTKTNQFAQTIVLPFGSLLNIILANLIKQQNPEVIIINDVLGKMSAEEVYNDVTQLNSLFRKKYNTREMFNNATMELKKYIYRMNHERNGLFTYHFISNNEMRKVIGQTLKVSNDFGKYSEDINGNDILIIDDSISQENTIKYACDMIKTTFTPRSINVLTLFLNL